MNIPDTLTTKRTRLFSKRALLLAPFALLALGVTGLNYAIRRFARRPLPPFSGSMTIPGLSKPVEIIRDRWGVPHIYAQTEHDLFFAQGFVQAQDRLFQMDVNRRVGAGRMSEIVGPAGLPSDRSARYFGWTRAAEAQISRTDPETRAMADAFAAGVNAYIECGPLPVEFTLLAYKPEPWEALASSAWGTVLAWGLSVNWETELLRVMLTESLGSEKAADLTPLFPDDYPTILPTGDVCSRLAEAILKAYRQAMTYLPLADLPLGEGVGSNNWVVSGDRTATGRPILANDPHLPPIFPAIWYENHLVGGRYNVTGFTTPGVPGVIIGHNEHVAWGVTNAFPDVQDLYLERFHPDDPMLYEVAGRWVKAELVTETIKVRGRKPVVEEVRYTRHGPVISDLLEEENRSLSLRWASYGRNNHMRAILEINRATGWESFLDGLRYWGFPSQNIIYADVKGNIGYKMPGMVPRRQNGDGLMPVPGWTDDYEWQGWLSFEELPARYNPPEGVIVTANNKIVGSEYPYLLTSEWLAGYRAERILELIEQAGKTTLADHGRIQEDTVSTMARRFLRAALPALAAIEGGSKLTLQARQILRRWDYDMRADSVGATIYFGWQVHFTRAAIAQAIGPELAAKLFDMELVEAFASNPFHKIAYELALRWLASGAPGWVGDVRPLLRPSFEKTVKVLRKEGGRHPEKWQWGNWHQLNLHNPASRIPALGRLWKPITLPVGGDAFTVNNSGVSPHFPPEPVHIIASCRLLLDVGAWDNSLAALPGGQSGQPASPHYQDNIKEWRDGRYHPLLFSREKIEEAAQGILTLQPVS